jgi:pyruvate/2-oxoglutarate dehydrogenase complex dihydrolipoamide dehydrogenase (E3) component
MHPEPIPAPLVANDRYDTELLAQLRPADWVNPEPPARYHLVVVGGGTAGLVTAAIAAALGARVALVERDLLGGDCLNTGCVPSKALLEASREWAIARGAAHRSGGPSAQGPGDFSAVMTRMRRLRAAISHHDSAARFRGLGVDVHLGEGRFSSESTLQVGDSTLRFRRAVVATGARPTLPPIPGLAEAGVLTSDTLFGLTTLPEALIVVGGGPIGCEMAQAFARFGSRVTLLEQAGRILPGEDPEASALLTAALQRDGVEVLCGATVRSARQGPDGREVTFEAGCTPGVVRATHILVATGRAPNVAGMGLEAAGVAFDPHSGIRVDERMRTSNRRIFAIGDVASRFHFTHAADAQARLVVRNALFGGRGRATELVIPWCTYTHPEVAHVGIPSSELLAHPGKVDTVTIAMSQVDRARLAGETEGFARIHLERGTDRIVAATLVMPQAGDLISQVTQAIVTRTPLSTLGSVIFPYPTWAESLRKAADLHGRRRLTPSVQRFFRLWFRWTA